MPRLRSPRWGPSKAAGPNEREIPWPLTCPPREGAARCQSHCVRNGYWYTGVPSIASRIAVAIGQLPTDSVSAGPINQNWADFGRPSHLLPGQPTRRPSRGRGRTGAIVCPRRDSAPAQCLGAWGPSDGSAVADVHAGGVLDSVPSSINSPLGPLPPGGAALRDSSIFGGPSTDSAAGKRGVPRSVPSAINSQPGPPPCGGGPTRHNQYLTAHQPIHPPNASAAGRQGGSSGVS